MTALGLRIFLQLGVLLGILAPEAIALVPKKQLVTRGFVATFAEFTPLSHNCDLLTKTTYSYDANGNRLTRKIGLYSYDFENRLTTLTKTTAGGEGNYEYTYDYRTRQVYRAEALTNGPNVETQIVFSCGTSIQEITLGNTPELAVKYIRGSNYGGGIGGILYTIPDSTSSFTHYNRRGDIVSKTDDNGIITYEAQYETFGTRLAESGTTEDRQKANTKDEDPTGLLNEGFRYRDLETGTFLTRDPLGFVDGPNMYAYVVQNPWTHFDPEGLSIWRKLWNTRKIPERFSTARKLGATKDLWTKVNRSDIVGKNADGFASVGGRQVHLPPAAKHKRGGTCTHTEASGTKYDVPISQEGWVDFSKYSQHDMKNFQMSGDSGLDIRRATAEYEAGGNVIPKNYTWHHHQDGSTMQLVPSELNAMRHTGGDAITKAAIGQIADSGGFMHCAKSIAAATGVAVGSVFAPNTMKAGNFRQGAADLAVDILDTVDPGVQDIWAGLWWVGDKATDLDLGGFGGAPQLSDVHDTWFGGDDK